jgi:hypothetical protein
MTVGAGGAALLLLFFGLSFAAAFIASALPHAHGPVLNLKTIGELYAKFPYPEWEHYYSLCGLRFVAATALLLGLFISGFGLRRSKPWARPYSVALGIVMAAAGAGSGLAEISWARPLVDRETKMMLAPGPSVLTTPDGRTVLKWLPSVTQMNQENFLRASNLIVVVSAGFLLYGLGLVMIAPVIRPESPVCPPNL